MQDKEGLQIFDFSHNITKQKKCHSFSKHSDQGCWGIFLMYANDYRLEGFLKLTHELFPFLEG